MKANEHETGPLTQRAENIEAQAKGVRLQEEAKEVSLRASGFSCNDFEALPPVTVSPCAESVRPPVGEDTSEGWDRDPSKLRKVTMGNVRRAARLLTAQDVARVVLSMSPEGRLAVWSAALHDAWGGGLTQTKAWAHNMRGKADGLRSALYPGDRMLDDEADRVEGLGELLWGSQEVAVSHWMAAGWVPARWLDVEGGAA